MRHSPAERRGYVLLLTLGLIALASISLAGLARHSLQLATSSSESIDDLQRRWGLLSIRHVLLERSAQILDAQVPDELLDVPPWPKPSQLTARFNLGDQHFSVFLSDEDAKLDLNLIYARKRERLVPAIRQAAHAAGSAAPPVWLVPKGTSGRPFASWGEVFDLPRIFDDSKVANSFESISTNMTCWGSGRLNLRRASDSAVREIASLVMSPKDVAGLIQHRKNWGGHGVDELLDGLGLQRTELLAARRLFGTDSNSFSLWVTVADGSRVQTHLYVDNGQPISFAW